MKDKSFTTYPFAYLDIRGRRSDLESEDLFDKISRASYFKSLEKALRNLNQNDSSGKKKVFI